MKREYHPQQLDHLRRVATEQETTIRRLRHELAVARARQARAEQLLAIARNDRAAWAKATAELTACGVSLDEVEAA